MSACESNRWVWSAPNPFLSYNESVAQGVAELMRLILMNAGQFYLCGYSQGAEVVVRTLRLMLPGQPLARRAGDLLKGSRSAAPAARPARRCSAATRQDPASPASIHQSNSGRAHTISS
jgi:hypothetical protein